MAFLSQNNDLQDEMTIEESIFASDNETLKVIFIYKTMETKKTLSMPYPNSWNYSARLKGTLM
jgi:hypothetical protein